MVPGTLWSLLLGHGNSTRHTESVLTICNKTVSINVSFIYFLSDIYGWGWNKYGQLGSTCGEMVVCPRRINVLDECIDKSGASITDVACGVTNSCILSSYGQVYVLGDIGINPSFCPCDSYSEDSTESVVLPVVDSDKDMLNSPNLTHLCEGRKFSKIFSSYHDGCVALKFKPSSSLPI